MSGQQGVGNAGGEKGMEGQGLMDFLVKANKKYSITKT